MTTQEIAKAAKHVEHLAKNYSTTEALTYLDQNFDKGAPGHHFASDYAKVYAAWQDLIEPDSSYGERARQESVRRESVNS